MATEEKLREYLKRVTVDLTEARRRLAEVEEGRHEPVAIVGMACRFPGAADAGEYWRLLREGRSGIVEVPPSRWDIDEYYNTDRRAVGGVYTRHGGFLPDIAGWDAGFFGVSPQEALRMDPHQRLLMELLWEGLEDAGTAPDRLAGSRTGVMVGYMDTVQYGRLESERYGPSVAADPYFGQGVSASVVAGRLAYQYDLHGPAVTIDTACSSSLVGVHLAANALRRGECDLAVAAGVFLIMQPDTYVQACATSMLAPDGRCKTFDATADGYVMGEGGGIVVLERLSSALRNGRRIRAVLRGSAVNQDGRSNGLTAPSRGAQADVIRRALAAARVEPDDVDFVEAHGSGTALGDAIELSALHDVFGDRPSRRPLPVGAVKTNIGHTQSAAGVAGLIKTVLTLEHGEIPPNLNMADPATAIPGDGSVAPVTVATALPTGRRIAGVSSFGWSGTNTHLVLEAAPAAQETAQEPAAPAGQALTLPVSAAGATALREQLQRLHDWLDTNPAADLADVAYTLATGRGEHDHRRAVTVTGHADALAQLASAAANPGVDKGKGRPRVAYLLAGVGDQYRGLGRELYASEPVYAAAVDALRRSWSTSAAASTCARCFAAEPVRAGRRLLPPCCAATSRPATTRSTAPRWPTRTSSPSSTRWRNCWRTRVSRPSVLLGYSLGEYVGACLAGVFTLADALTVVVERARLIATAPAGRMVAAAADAETVRALVASVGVEVDVAAAERAGDDGAVRPAGRHRGGHRRAARRGVASQPLRTPHAFHSSLLEPARAKLSALIESVQRSVPTLTIISNRTGEPLTAEQATSADYWAEHLVSPVRFAQSVRHAVAAGVDVFVELGAGQTLGGLVRQNLTSPVAVLGTLPAGWTAGADADGLRTTLARLWELGAPVDWPAVQGRGRIVTLPGYAFQRTRFWPEPGAALPAATSSKPTDLCYAPTWKRTLATPASGALTLPGPLVVYADADGIGAALAAAARAGGTEVIEVVPGDAGRDGQRVSIDPTDPGSYREVFAGLGDGPVHVAHLWSLRAPAGFGDEALAEAVRIGHHSALLAIQALGELPGARLLTASRGGLEVLGGDAVAASQVAAHGLARVADHEYAGLRWTGVDLDPVSSAETAAAQLAHELHRRGTAAPDRGRLAPGPPLAPGLGTGTVHYGRPGVAARRRVPDHRRYPGLGLALARHLVQPGVRKLALVGRSSLDGDSERAQRSRADVAALEAAGARCCTLTADAGRPDELRAALRRAREHFGALNGVIHVGRRPGQRHGRPYHRGGRCRCARAQGGGARPAGRTGRPGHARERAAGAAGALLLGGHRLRRHRRGRLLRGQHGARRRRCGAGRRRAVHPGADRGLGAVAARRLAGGRGRRGRRWAGRAGRRLPAPVRLHRRGRLRLPGQRATRPDRRRGGGPPADGAGAGRVERDARHRRPGRRRQRAAQRGALPPPAAAGRLRGPAYRAGGAGRRRVGRLPRHRPGRHPRPVLRPRRQLAGRHGHGARGGEAHRRADRPRRAVRTPDRGAVRRRPQPDRRRPRSAGPQRRPRPAAPPRPAGPQMSRQPRPVRPHLRTSRPRHPSPTTRTSPYLSLTTRHDLTTRQDLKTSED